MFVCICKAKRERDILESIQQAGANTVGKVTKHCEAGGDCGACRIKIDQILREQNTTLGTDSDPES